MARKNRFEVPIQYEAGGGPIEVKKRNFWEDYNLSPAEVERAKRLLAVLGDLYWEEKETEESVA